MIALLQRVSEARVTADGVLSGSCGAGLLVLFCAEKDDTEEKARRLAAKTARLRIFEDSEGKMNRSLLDAGGSVLAVSQFTLAAEVRSGTRPSFSAAAGYEEGRTLYEAYVEALKALGVHTETGVYGAHMQVSLTNDGPVTIPLKL